MIILRDEYAKDNYRVTQILYNDEHFVRIVDDDDISWLSDNYRFDELENIYQKELREQKLKRILDV